MSNNWGINSSARRSNRKALRGQRKQAEQERRLTLRHRWYAGGIATLLSGALMFTGYMPAMAADSTSTDPATSTDAATPTPTDTPSATPSATPTETATPTPTASPSQTTAPQTKSLTQTLAAPQAPVASCAAGWASQLVAGFEIDGNICLNDTNNKDWSSVGGQPVANDGYGDSTEFTSGAKESNWPWSSGQTSGSGTAPGKTDIGNVYAYTQTVSGDVYAYLGFERQDNTGSVAYHVELNKLPNSPAGSPVPNRSVGDLRLTINQNGNTLIQLVGADTWTGSAWKSLGNLSGFIGQTNQGNIVNLSSQTLLPGAFAEAAIDLTTLFGKAGCSGNYGVLNVRSSSSPEDSSSLADWIKPVALNVPSTCSTLTILKTNQANQPLAGAKFTVSPDPTTGVAGSQATGTTDANGQIVFSGNVLPGTYSVTETQAPTGYLMPASPTQSGIVIGEAQSKTVTFVDPLGTVKFQKTDVDGNLLGGATFQITATGGAAAAAPWNLNTNPITVVDNGANDTDPAAGKFSVANLPLGTYSVKETAAPAGFVGSTATQTFSVTQNSPNPSISTAFVNTPVLVCAANTFYSVSSNGTLRKVANGQISTIGDWNTGQTDANGLAINKDGSVVYAFLRTSGGISGILRYTQATGVWETIAGTTGLNIPNNDRQLVAGAVNLATGNYLFGGYDSNGGSLVFRVFSYNPNTNAVSSVGYIDTGLSSGATSNGDMAFDANGNLYVVRSGSDANIFTVTAANLANPGAGGKLTSTATNSTALGLNDVNGMAFDVDGTVFLGNGSTVNRYDSNGWVNKGNITSSLNDSTDLASCNSPATLTLKKNVVGRAAPGDQFVISVVNGQTTVASATTSGSATGIQAQQVGPVPVVITNTYGIAEVAAPGSNPLTAYSTTWSCDNGQSGTGTAGNVTIPAQNGVSVTCTFTNTVKNVNLKVSKTAKGSFDRAYTWAIDKSVTSGASAQVQPGTDALFSYKVVATPSAAVDSNFKVAGKITVTNDNAIDVPLTSVADQLPNGTCTITQAAPYTVPAHGSLVLDYSCAVANATAATTGTNTATVNWSTNVLPGTSGTAQGTAGFDFSAAPTVSGGTAVVTDSAPEFNSTFTLAQRTLQATGGPKTFTYTRNLGHDVAAGQCKTYDNTATVTPDIGTPASDSASVQACAGADLTVTKTVIGSLTRTFDWSIDKSVDATTKNVDASGNATFHYTVKATPGAYTDSQWAMSGSITVHNPNAWDVTGTVTDLPNIGGGVNCTVTGGAGAVIPAGQDKTFAYSCTFTSQPGLTGTNTATVKWDAVAAHTAGSSATGTAPITDATWAKTLVNNQVTVIDDKTNPASPVTLGTAVWNAQGTPFVFTYDVTLPGTPGTCVDFTNNAWLKELPNVKDAQKVTVCDYSDLSVSKTANTAFTRTYSYDIAKNADKTRIDGDSGDVNYTVTVSDKSYADTAFVVSGTITVHNPNTTQATVKTITDKIGATTCTVTLPANLVVAAGGDITATYTCALTGVDATTVGQNVASATWDTTGLPGSTGQANGSATYDFTKATITDVNKTVNVVDDKTNPGSSVALGTHTWGNPGPSEDFTYKLTLQGTPGTCKDYTNTASITQTKQSAQSTVTVCDYKNLTVTKTANPSFARDFDWTITKDVDQTSAQVNQGQNAPFAYTVTATKSAPKDSAFVVKGSIKVTNPNATPVALTGLTDSLPSGDCTITGSTTQTVPANGSVTLNYTCTLPGATATTSDVNTATATWTLPGTTGSASGQAGFDFSKVSPALTDDTASVSDTAAEFSALPGSKTINQTTQFTYTRQLGSTVAAGTCQPFPNTATVTATDSKAVDQASQSVTVCVNPNVVVKKTVTSTTENPDGTWTIVYDLKVTNPSSTVDTTYDLSDTLQFGGGITINSATWAGAGTGDFAGAVTKVFATGKALAHSTTDTYTVTVNATVGQNAWTNHTTECAENGSGPGGFLNTAKVTSGGKTSTDWACDTPGSLTIKKSVDGSVTQNADGTFTVKYDVTVTNASDKAQWYSLSDTPAFSSGVTIQASSATDRNGNAIPGYNGTLATGVQISAAQGGQAKVDTYTVSYTVKVTGSLDTATCQGSGTGLFNSATLSTGTITLDDSACVNIPTGKITLKKVVQNLNGGTRPNTDWTLFASGPTAGISGHTGDSAVTSVVAATGTYALGESTYPGYHRTDLVCTNGEQTLTIGQGDTVAVAAGANVVCTFTNTDIPATLTLTKNVDEEAAGGSVTADQFILTATPIIPPTPAGTLPYSGNGKDGFIAKSIPAGQYTLSETGPSGFIAGTWSCVGGSVGETNPVTHTAVLTIGVGQTASCEITNTAIKPKLTLVKVVDDQTFAGAGRIQDWTLTADGPTVVSGTGDSSSIVDQGVKVGTYSLSEVASGPTFRTAGYNLTNIVCKSNTTEWQATFDGADLADASIALHEGDDVTCTFTNTPTPAKWTVSKTSDKGLSVMPGDTITYTIKVMHDPTTSWPALFSLPNLDDLSSLQANATQVGGFSVTPNIGTVTRVGNELSLGSLDLSGTPSVITITYAFKVNANAWNVQLKNALTPPEDVLCIPTADTEWNNGCTTLQETPDLNLYKTSEVTKGVDPTNAVNVLPGGEVTYTLNAHNFTGADLVAGQTETDDLSNVLVHGATLVTPLDPALVYNASDKTLTWTLPAIDAGDSASVSFAVKVSDQAGPYNLDNVLVPGTIGHCPPVPEEVSREAVSEDPSCTTHNEVPKIDVGIDKSYLLNEGQTAVDDDPGASSEYTYGLDVTNHSTTGVQNVTVTDKLPSEIKLDTTKGTNGFSAIPAGWHPSYDAATNTVTIAIDAMAVDETGSITLHVVVQPVVVTGPIADPGTSGPKPTTPPATIDNTACVSVALDSDSSNNCSTVKVPQKTINANIWVQCVADVPYLNYDITGTNVDPTLPVTLTWTANQPGVGGVPADDLPPVPANLVRTLHIGDSGKILWPGGAVTPAGVGIGFPGWRAITEADLNPDGTMKDPSAITFQGLVYDRLHVATDAWRYESTVTIHINPTQTVTVSYPPASAACAVQRPTDLTIKKTASVSTVTPGSNFTYDMVVTNVNLGAASPVTVTDKIPADLKITGITTSTTDFPRWTNCAVTGQDGSGYGGNLTCSLFGPLKLGETAPKITLAATLNSASKATSITNTGVVTWTNTDNPSDTGSAESSVTVGVPQPLAVTGGTLLWQLLPFGMLVIIAGTGLLLVNRRRKNGEKAPQV